MKMSTNLNTTLRLNSETYSEEETRPSRSTMLMRFRAHLSHQTWWEMILKRLMTEISITPTRLTFSGTPRFKRALLLTLRMMI
jgi:hypothetical protein